MEITQRRFTNRTTFLFDDQRLTYTVRDRSGARTFSVEYAAIPDVSGTLEERNEWFRNVGFAWLGLGVVEKLILFKRGGGYRSSLWFGLGLFFVAFYYLAKTEYSLIDTERGRIFVIKGGRHDEVLDMIARRRKAQLLQRFGKIDPANDAKAEEAKFRWLRELGAISERELSDVLGEVRKGPEGRGPAEGGGRKLN